MLRLGKDYAFTGNFVLENRITDGIRLGRASIRHDRNNRPGPID
ncbi:hypothetical protein QO005_004119 [Rhizobium paknamense]|uniref:Uncharacterized protein n=1 Tax=Rhizobium paknamense TaxID=1206817 RepID=A0ABU0IKI8_9HYPH|nr:hypothetical protein [Rhizobium paknamense]